MTDMGSIWSSCFFAFHSIRMLTHLSLSNLWSVSHSIQNINVGWEISSNNIPECFTMCYKRKAYYFDVFDMVLVTFVHRSRRLAVGLGITNTKLNKNHPFYDYKLQTVFKQHIQSQKTLSCCWRSQFIFHLSAVPSRYYTTQQTHFCLQIRKILGFTWYLHWNLIWMFDVEKDISDNAK